MKRNYLIAIAVALCVILAGLYVYGWINRDEPVDRAVIARPSEAVENVPRKAASMKKPLKVYEGGSALKDGLKLPPELVSNVDVEIVASSEVKASRRAHEITTTVNTQTGEVETYQVAKPLPWFEVTYDGEVGVYAGIRDLSEPSIRVEARQAFVNVKALQVQAIGSVDVPMNGGDVSSFAGVGVVYRW